MQQKKNEAKKYTLKKARGYICLQIVHNVKQHRYECAEIYANGEISTVERRGAAIIYSTFAAIFLVVCGTEWCSTLTIKCTTW